MESITRERIAAAVALIVVQVVHALVPDETDSEGSFGLVAGVVLLAASVAALAGLIARRDWGRRLLGITGAAVAAGFLLYHVVPVDSPVTNPYVGEPAVGLAQWAPVIAAIVIGIWAAYASVRKAQHGPVTP